MLRDLSIAVSALTLGLTCFGVEGTAQEIELPGGPPICLGKQAVEDAIQRNEESHDRRVMGEFYIAGAWPSQATSLEFRRAVVSFVRDGFRQEIYCYYKASIPTGNITVTVRFPHAMRTYDGNWPNDMIVFKDLSTSPAWNKTESTVEIETFECTGTSADQCRQ